MPKVGRDKDGDRYIEFTHEEAEQLFGCWICPKDGSLLPLPRWAWEKTDCEICKAAGYVDDK